MKNIKPYLMFQENKARGAIDFYTSIFKDSRVEGLNLREDGTVLGAVLKIKDLEIMIFDSDINHQFDFTPAFSFFINCDDEQELKDYVDAFSEFGVALMPLDNYGFSKAFTWINDEFGISWQFNLE